MPTRYAVLLRGVNVGGRRRVGMAGLRDVLTGLGYDEVSTYLQSGNAVITAGGTDRRLERQIEAALQERVGVTTRVLVRTGAELAATIEANPFPEAESAPTTLHVAFLAERRPAPPDLSGYAPDRLAVGDRVAYLHYPNGSGRSKLASDLERLVGVATARNWRTVLALAERTAP